MFWGEVEIIDSIMGSNKFEEIPTMQMGDVRLYANKKKGLVLITDNNFFHRVWFLLSNPFRYIFIGKIKY